MEEKILETLLDSNRKMAEISNHQANLLDEVKELRHKAEKHGEELAVLQTSLKNLGNALEAEKRLNRDGQLSLSNLLDEKISTIYKLVSVVAFIISMIVSLIPNFINFGG